MATKVYFRKCCRKRTSLSPDWSNIDCDLYEYIQKKMPFADMLKCRAICRSWRHLTEAHIRFSLKSPALMLPKQYLLSNINHQEDCFEPSKNVGFLNVEGKRLYKLSDKAREELRCLRWFVGSSHGWILFLDVHFHFCMFNPSFDACARLVFHRRCVNKTCIIKAVLWSDPVLGNDSCGAVFIVKFIERRRLFYAKNGDKQCSFLVGQAEHNISYHDIICFRSCVYGVTEKGSIQAWDCSTFMYICDLYMPKRVLDIQPCFEQGKEYRPGSKFYLVESLGELLLVSRFGFKTVSFQVYKLDFDRKEWVNMESLGDRVLFLSGNQSLSFSAQEFPEFQSNSIYFDPEGGDHAKGGPGICVYNMDGGDAHQTYL